MAGKKNNIPDKPVVSRVPLPVSDSALVIDLPDGQKLVIGKMGQGTVIEVATWRGVGRPDSRTSRMMFGMSSAEIDVENPNAAVNNPADFSGGLVSRILNYPMMLIRWLFNIQHVPKPKKNKDGSKKLIIETSDNQTTPDTSDVKRIILVASKKIAKKSLLIGSKIYSVGSERVMKLLKKQRSPKNVRQELTSSDMNIEKWLDSLTTPIKKSEITARSSASNARKKKK
ncbi:hypothetical protein MCEGKSH29_01035 [Candidatus Nanopelagicaceae bacterium]